jgi:hypothetical protein
LPHRKQIAALRQQIKATKHMMKERKKGLAALNHQKMLMLKAETKAAKAEAKVTAGVAKAEARAKAAAAKAEASLAWEVAILQQEMQKDEAAAEAQVLQDWMCASLNVQPEALVAFRRQGGGGAKPVAGFEDGDDGECDAGDLLAKHANQYEGFLLDTTTHTHLVGKPVLSRADFVVRAAELLLPLYNDAFLSAFLLDELAWLTELCDVPAWRARNRPLTVDLQSFDFHAHAPTHQELPHLAAVVDERFGGMLAWLLGQYTVLHAVARKVQDGPIGRDLFFVKHQQLVQGELLKHWQALLNGWAPQMTAKERVRRWLLFTYWEERLFQCFCGAAMRQAQGPSLSWAFEPSLAKVTDGNEDDPRPLSAAQVREIEAKMAYVFGWAFWKTTCFFARRCTFNNHTHLDEQTRQATKVPPPPPSKGARVAVS